MATRVEAMEKARRIKTEKVKGKIQTAINILNLYGAKITVRAVSSESGVATSTVQKYLSTMKPKEKNKTDQSEKEIEIDPFWRKVNNQVFKNGQILLGKPFFDYLYRKHYAMKNPNGSATTTIEEDTKWREFILSHDYDVDGAKYIIDLTLIDTSK